MLIEDFLDDSEDVPSKDQDAPKASPLISLEKDLIYYSESIREIALEIVEAQVSNYPVFLAHQHELSLGEIILDRNELGTDWTIQVSTMEEMIEAGVMDRSKEANFKKSFKDPNKYMCVLAIVPQGANFVFFPYK